MFSLLIKQDVNKYEVLAGDAPNPARPKRGRTEYTDLDDYKLLRYFEENNGRDSIKFFREMSLGCVRCCLAVYGCPSDDVEIRRTWDEHHSRFVIDIEL